METQGKRLIATFDNRVTEIVPEYRQKHPNDGTITVNKDSVIAETYAPFSENTNQEGMYICAHTINDGDTSMNPGAYDDHQLVAKVDLKYRVLVPTGEGDSENPSYNPILDVNNGGCVRSSNSNKTIEIGTAYSTTLTPVAGRSTKVPAGYVSIQTGENTWTLLLGYSWSTTSGSVDINIPADKVTGNIKIEFTEGCVGYILTIIHEHADGEQEEIRYNKGCDDEINIEGLADPKTGETFNHAELDELTISGNHTFCEDTTLIYYYTANEYNIDYTGVNSDCVELVIESNGQRLNPIPSSVTYGTQLTIKLTPVQGKANIGPGYVTMGGVDVDRWTTNVPSKTINIQSVTGNIVISADCGEDAKGAVTFIWRTNDTVLCESNSIFQSGTTVLASDHKNDYTEVGYDLSDYNIANGTPASVTVLTGGSYSITYKCTLIPEEPKVTFIGDEHTTIIITPNPITSQNQLISKNISNVCTFDSNYELNNIQIVNGTGSENLTFNNGVITITNITRDITVQITSKEHSSKRVSRIVASEIDAMGGVKFTAIYDDNTTEDITESGDEGGNLRVNSYTAGGNTTNVTQELVKDVYDYNFKDYNQTLGKGVYTKLRIPQLETANTGSQSGISFNVTYNGTDYTTNETTRRAELYGYYTGITSTTLSEDLVDDGTWVSNGELVDFGDSCNMYGLDQQQQGLDIYNYDVTPYYIPGTYIGENPLNNLGTNKVRFVGEGLPESYNTNNTNYGDHYHILWDDTSPTSIKGCIFYSDNLTSSLDYCGNVSSNCLDGSCCDQHSLSKESQIEKTVEAVLKNSDNSDQYISDDNIRKYGRFSYEITFKKPVHNYGRDSISYYHLKNDTGSTYEYYQDVEDDIFKDENKTSNKFSYPLHINTSKLGSSYSISELKSDLRPLISVRWEENNTDGGDIPESNLYYDRPYSGVKYYDYKNKIYNSEETYNVRKDNPVTNNVDDISYFNIEFEPYNQNYYKHVDDDYLKSPNDIKLSDSDTAVSRDLTNDRPEETGRIITAYLTIMSAQNRIRLSNNNNVYLYIALDRAYSNINYDVHESRVEHSLSEYYNDTQNPEIPILTYVSVHDIDRNNDRLEHVSNLIIDLTDFYPYNINGNNMDFLKEITNDGYLELSQIPSISIDENLKEVFRNREYNLCTYLQYEQYSNYNKEEENGGGSEEHYLYNDDHNKYVACAGAFGTGSYEFFYNFYLKNGDDSWVSVDNMNWSDIVNDSPRMERQNDGYYHFEKDNVEYRASLTTRIYYLESNIDSISLYTNADRLKIKTNSSTCLGSIKVEFENDNKQIVSGGSYDNDELSDESGVTCSILGKKVIITPYVQTSQPTPFAIRTTFNADYQRDVSTGGGIITVIAGWNNNDIRTIEIPIGGSCDSPSSGNDNNGKSGAALSWKQLYDHYCWYDGGVQQKPTNTESYLYYNNKLD